MPINEIDGFIFESESHKVKTALYLMCLSKGLICLAQMFVDIHASLEFSS